MSEKIFVIHWRGPFTESEIETMDESGVLYLATGRLDGERKSKIQYFGLTEQSICSRFKDHHKLARITADLQIWIGWIKHPRTNKKNLEMAERLLIYLWQPSLNERKRVNLPAATSLLCHWFDATWEPLRSKPKIVAELYDVICWDQKYWHTGHLDHWKNY